MENDTDTQNFFFFFFPSCGTWWKFLNFFEEQLGKKLVQVFMTFKLAEKFTRKLTFSHGDRHVTLSYPFRYVLSNKFKHFTYQREAS